MAGKYQKTSECRHPDKRLSAGNVIVEVAQPGLSTPADAKARVDHLGKDGRKPVPRLVSNAAELRFIALGSR